MPSSMYVIGFVPPDERYAQMYAVWDACKKAKVEIPYEVESFFEDVPEPSAYGMEVDVSSQYWEPENKGWPAQGLEVNISRLDPKIKLIRFYISG